jgi:hypothetical protein
VKRSASRSISTCVATLWCCVALLLFVLACGGDYGPVAQCSAAPSLAVRITVRDSVSDAAAADGAIGTLMGSSSTDTLAHEDSLTLFGGNQLGTYTVRIERAGYLTWMRSDVRVTKVSVCGSVVPVELTAKLQSLTP